ncbi:MAG TPA: hypothetical protein VHO84_04405, partial [Syntrophorhabdaceae bacterium]|nr:hypothetical protein [Syntrophorhabdaceae bacterium]
EQFAKYVEAFNVGNFEVLEGCLNKDVLIGIGSKKDLTGREAVLDFCRSLKTHAEITIDIKKFVSSERLLATELQFRLHALDELPDLTSVPLKKDSHMLINMFALCNLSDGRFAQIRLAKFSQEEFA